jgi:hypothetical protein
MPQRHANELLGNLSHATFPPTRYTNQWTTGQWHQSLIRDSRYVTNPPTRSITQSHRTQHTVHTSQPGKSSKSILFTSYFHTLMFGYIIFQLQKRTLPHTKKLKMYYYWLILQKCTCFWLQKYLLPQRLISYNDVLSLINSTILWL